MFSLRDRLQSFITRTHSFDQQFSSEWKKEKETRLEIWRRDAEEKKKLEEATKKYHDQIRENVSKIYTDAFLPKFFDDEMKGLEKGVGNKVFATENKTSEFLDYGAELLRVDHRVTTFGSENSTDKYAQSVVTDSVKDNSDAQMFLCSFDELERCYSVIQRLNPCAGGNHFFWCESHRLPGHALKNGATMYFRRKFDDYDSERSF